MAAAPVALPDRFARMPDSPRSPSMIGCAHYDVKPAGDHTAWTRDPWGGDIHGGRLYGRGADDKSGCLAFVFAAEACFAGGACRRLAPRH